MNEATAHWQKRCLKIEDWIQFNVYHVWISAIIASYNAYSHANTCDLIKMCRPPLQVSLN